MRVARRADLAAGPATAAVGKTAEVPLLEDPEAPRHLQAKAARLARAPQVQAGVQAEAAELRD
jgi:hypothetical protein